MARYSKDRFFPPTYEELLYARDPALRESYYRTFPPLTRGDNKTLHSYKKTNK